MKNSGVGAVVLAYVIADNRIRTPVSAVAGSADKHKTSIVIMTVVILKDGSITMVITIERLAVHSPHHAGNLIELEERICTTPRPHACGIVQSTHTSADQCIIFDQSTLTTYWNNTVAADVLKQITADNNISAWIPVSSGIIRGIPEADPVSVRSNEVTIFY